jgi:SAM-dependent methyltransferase
MSPDAYIEMADVESRHWWFVGRRSILTWLLERLELPADAKVLEIGSGTGGNLVMLSRFGQISAMEMDTTAREIAAKKTDGRFDIRAGHCPEQIPFANEKFDLICLFDVLEHIEDDQGTLDAIGQMLSERGRVVLTVPAYQWMWSVHDEFLHHKRRYSREGLRQKIDRARFKVTRLSYFNTMLLPLAVLARIKDRLLGGGKATGAGIPPTPVNALFTLIFSAERFMLGGLDLPFGVSLLAVMQKKDG